MGTKVTGNKI
ncbi:hypothetical protein LSH36_494g02013 [Paralvinella palmiformis]|uniref:Uncharacterized protein n=1 Tax=Paralvinella palmiformis TaxID=53620 RepID=A0AAD9MYM1_9ANNE|nr:hypothetical protein LSH36_494g02013 [Paralvinella palmiformis]